MSPTLARPLVLFLLASSLASVASAQTWNVVPEPDPPGESLLRAVAPVGVDEAWAVGTQQTPSYYNHTLIAHYVNGAWTVVSSPNPDPSCQDGNVVYGGNRLNAIAALSPTDIWVAGTSCLEIRTLIEHWDGVSWSIVPSPSPLAENILSGLEAVAPNDVWAVGHTEEDIGAGTLVEHWNGTSWSVVPSPKPGTGGILGGIDAVSASDIWAAGSYYDEAEGLWENLITHWDGTAWTEVPSVSPGTYTNALGPVAVVSANDVWTVGAYSSGSGVLTLAEHWDGHHWSVVPTPNVATGYGTTNTLGSVVVRSANDVWAAGSYQNQDTEGQSRTLLMHWNGASWSIVPSPSPGKSSGLTDIAFGPTGEAWGVGIYSEYPIDIYDGHYTLAQSLTLGTGDAVSAGPGDVSLVATLGRATPNPASRSTSFALHLPRTGDVALSIFDLRGREIRTMRFADMAAGDRSLTWNGLDRGGAPCRAGLYVARLTVDGAPVASRSIVLVEVPR